MPKLLDVTVPVGQAEGTESVVSTWFKSVGDSVNENEPLLEISTDKVNMEVAASATGVLAEILKQDGDPVEPGDVLGRIDTEVDATVSANADAPPSPAPQADGTERNRGATGGSGELSPAVRKLLKERGLDASQITGTGKGGRITADDVMNHADAPKKSGLAGRMVPHSQMRRSIAKHMVQSMMTAPHVTSVFEADMSAVIADRAAKKADFENRGVKLTFTA